MDSSKGSGIGGVESGTTAIVKRKRNQPTRSSARLRNQTLPFEVFNNHLIREKIVEYLVLDAGHDQEDNRKTACSLRLVDKTWNETVIKILHKNQQPLFTIAIHGRPELSEFCSTFSSSIEINGSIPPFVLEVDHCGSEYISQLNNVLTHCGEGLIGLEMWTNGMGNPYLDEFPQWSLGRLRKLDVSLEVNRPPPDGGVASFGQDGQPENAGSRLIKSVLRDATTISEFTITVFSGRVPVTHPLSNWSFFESVNLPATISILKLIGRMSMRDLGMLAKHHLPNLKLLEMSGDFDSLDTESFFALLDNFRASLKTLSIWEIYHQGPPPNPIAIRFPVLEQLEELSIISSNLNLRLEAGLHSLQRFIPKLLTLTLQHQTAEMLQKWTQHSKFTSITNLQFSLSDKNFPLGSHKFIKSLSMETMQSVNFAFPNLRKLELGLSGSDTSGLEYLFKEMTQLTKLKLSYCCGDGERESMPDFWDGVLTGVPVEAVAREDPDFWQRYELNEAEELSSIKNLQELTSLSFSDDRYFISRLRQPIGALGSFISDVTFQHALLKMPNLKNLHLQGRFVASDEMTEVWRNEGRSLVYKEYRMSR